MPPPTATAACRQRSLCARQGHAVRDAGRPVLNGRDVVVMYFVPGRGRWAVYVPYAKESVLVRPEHLCVKPAPHRETREAGSRRWRRPRAGVGGGPGSNGFGVGLADGEPTGDEPVERELPADLVVLALFPLLERCTRTESGGGSPPRQQPRRRRGRVARVAIGGTALRALTPACARDVGLAAARRTRRQRRQRRRDRAMTAST